MQGKNVLYSYFSEPEILNDFAIFLEREEKKEMIPQKLLFKKYIDDHQQKELKNAKLRSDIKQQQQQQQRIKM